VTVGLSAAGAIDVYNLTGTVDVIVDIVGYYQRASGGGAGGSQSVLISGVGFVPTQDTSTFFVSHSGVFPNSNSCFARVLDLPNGATVTQVDTSLFDNSASASASLQMLATPFATSATVLMTSIGTSTVGVPGIVNAGDTTIAQPTINNALDSYDFEFCGGLNADLINATITYTLP
jgi:hypothetical protein